jgi:peptidoglycan/xylan/chitin deacetylase (PgdA/CDA1 family)
MKMYPVRIPTFIQKLMPAYTWRLPVTDRVLYLTFDDGPIPEVTPWVLETLRAYGAKATFFCVGDNIRKHPDLFRQVKNEGHSVGNHTFNHLKGWKTDDAIYLDNIRQCASLLPEKLFRPPYGRLRRSQRKLLQLEQYRLIMWDVLSGDFDRSISPEQCRDNVLNNAGPGSIIVMHDSLKSIKNLRVALPGVLQYFTDKGYRFGRIDAGS